MWTPKRDTTPQIERNNEIIRLASAGDTYESIAIKFNITRQRVHQIAQRGGVVKRPSKGSRCQMN